MKSLATLAFFFAVLSSGQDRPELTKPELTKLELTVDQIVENHVEALGGIEKMRASHSFSATGKASMMNGRVEAPMVMQMKRPSSMRIDMVIQNRQIVQAFDGNTAWSINAATGSDAPKRATPAETEEMKSSADLDFSSLADYRAKGNAVELAGVDNVDGRRAYKLKVTKQNGRVEYDYLDAKTFLPVKTVTKRRQLGAEVDIEAYPSNFRPVNGVLFPFRVDQKADGKLLSQLMIEKVAVNMPLDDTVFKIPDSPGEKSIPGKNF